MRVPPSHILIFLCFSILPSEGQNCQRPHLANGRVKLKQRGHFVTFKCFRPFTLVGSSKAMCINGEWHFALPPPICVNSGCTIPQVNSTSNGELETKSNGAIMILSCHPGHIIAGSSDSRVSSFFNYTISMTLLCLKLYVSSKPSL